MKRPENSKQIHPRRICEQFKPLKQTAIVSARLGGLELLDGSWAGELRADGQIIRVTRPHRVYFRTDKTREEARRAETERTGSKRTLRKRKALND